MYQSNHASPSKTRRLAEALVKLLVLVLLFQTWVLQGFPVPCQVRGGSMAEGLRGTHYQVVCDDCRFRFACDADGPTPVRAVCPNCGYAHNDLEGQPTAAGDRVLVDRSAFLFRPPRRWELVAFRQPQRPNELAVKRVVGLPEESIAIRAGDVYVDGQIVRKTLPQQHALAVLVHDSRYRSTDPALPPRWHGVGAESQWEAGEGRFGHPAGDASAAIDWLIYSHWRRSATDGKVVATPVTDLCGYNQSLPRREEDVHATPDLLLSLRLVEEFGEGLLILRACDGGQRFEARIDPRHGRYEVRQNDWPLPTGSGCLPRDLRGATLEVSLVDQQFLLAIDGRTLVAWPFERAGDAPPPPCEPLAIGSQGLGMVVDEVRVYRDVYYCSPLPLWERGGGEGVMAGTAHSVATSPSPCPLPPGERETQGTYRLGADEYFVLGDNSPISEDSRTWYLGRGCPAAGLSATALVGKPFAILFASSPARRGSHDFQVPDTDRIRYIR